MACSRPQNEAEGEIQTGPNWLELPREVTQNILQRLETVQIVTSACLVCPLWWNICKEPLLWRTIVIRDDYPSFDYLDRICRYAVQRSSGHLEGIDIPYICTDELLKFIADRACHLKRMQLSNSLKISDEGLVEVAKKLPLLEELDISNTKITKKSLEVIGNCCPLLKSLKFGKMFRRDEEYDEEAFAIAKTMPELRHLDINCNDLTNDGLIAILDGCHLLEILDVGGCIHLDLSGSLGKRCREQIKELLVDRSGSYLDHIDTLGDGIADMLSDSEYDLTFPLNLHSPDTFLHEHIISMLRRSVSGVHSSLSESPDDHS